MNELIEKYLNEAIGKRGKDPLNQAAFGIDEAWKNFVEEAVIAAQEVGSNDVVQLLHKIEKKEVKNLMNAMSVVTSKLNHYRTMSK